VGMSSGRIVPIIMGSHRDYGFAKGIGDKLDEFDVPNAYRVASGEKHTGLLLKIMGEYENEKALIFNDQIVYVTVAGRSNKLSGIVAGNTTYPVIAAPPDGDKTALQMDIWSSVRSPSESPVVTVLGAGNAALAAVRVFSLTDGKLRKRLERYCEEVRKGIEEQDEKFRNGEFPDV